MINLKTFLVVVGILLLIIFGGYFYMESKFNDQLSKIQNDLEMEKEQIQEETKKKIIERDQTISEIRKENKEILIQSQKLYEALRKKNINPDYDLNFLQSADLISKSKYRSGE